ncbi:uncharacterized protein L201_003026 [Kwoniella dendrophila CBS 6074]|uniref:Mediator of RNA polymerase II transcription subunit 19 n=1 Tax=Kwoniella dendrophila CBS 6074 TaxID=1295534 RepID=A0AAX4JU91_9TREE
MDLIQNGESSKSPRHQNTLQTNGHSDGDIVMGEESRSNSSNLILPQWDVPPPRHLHSSQDLISSLHLDTLYNTYVRPYAEINPEDNNEDGQNTKQGQQKQQQHRRKKMEKGYWHLIEDCIDPTPTGTKLDNQSLLPISQDFMHPHGLPPNLFGDQIEMLPSEAFQIAKLEPGHKEDGYSGGIKVGVKEAEERRRKKRAAKLSIAPSKSSQDIQSQTQAIPSPGLPSPSFPYQIPGIQSRPGSTPGTPLLPVLPPTKFTGNNNNSNNSNNNGNLQRKGSLPPYNPGAGNVGGVKPSFSQQQQNNSSRPYNPNKRPGSVESNQINNNNQQQHNSKKFKSGSVGPSTSSGIPYKPTNTSRSASPMPLNSNNNNNPHRQQSQQSQQQKQYNQQGRPYKPGIRSKTEGV